MAVEKMLSPAPGIRGYTPLTIIAAPLFEILTLHDREVDAGRKERDTGFITREEVENLFAFLAFSATRTEPSPPVGVAQADEAALPADLDPVAQRILELREWIQLETIQYESLRAKPETDEVLRELGTSAAQLAVAWSSLSELESDPTRVQSAEGFVEASISAFNRLDKDSMGVVATSFENLGDSQDGLGYPVSALVYHVIASSLFGHLGRDSDRQRDEKIVKIRPKKSDE